jgi:uncharacterized protein
MTQPAKSQEPSMEEILASIRRIIADDDANKSTQRTATEAPAPPVRPAAPPRPMAVPDPEPPPPVALEPEPEPEPEPEFAEEPSSEILDLTDAMAVSPPPPTPSPAPQFRRIEGKSDVSFEEESEEPATPLPPPALDLGRNQAPRADDSDHLLSRQTSTAIDSAFNALAQTVLVQNARTLEDLVREMLRPMLKSWLDDNLPGMVERLVRAEIERVSRGR